MSTDNNNQTEFVIPMERAMNILSGKWKPLIIYHLLGGTKRFGSLQRAIPGVTRRMLTQHLRELEADGIVHREVYKQVPPKVEYSLTEKGRSLKPVLDVIEAWALEHLAEPGEKVFRSPEEVARALRR